jgi:hypothetical protein
MTLRHAPLLAALVLAGCKASNPTVPRPPVRPSAEPAAAPAAAEPAAPAPTPATASVPASALAPGDPVVARIGDEEITVSELLETWMMTDSNGVRDLLGTLATARLVRAEATRLGIRLEEELVDTEFAIQLGELERELRARQPGVSLDEWIEGGLGLESTRYRLAIREDIERRLYAERVVRHHILTHENADIAVIVLDGEAEAAAALERLAAGESFSDLARELSVDPSGERSGGRLPPIVRNDSSLSRLAFSTPAGEVGGPMREGPRWLLLLNLGVHPPIEPAWESAGPRVEESLLLRPIEQPEFLLWKAEMQARSPADFEPFFELVGGRPR